MLHAEGQMWKMVIVSFISSKFSSRTRQIFVV